MGGVWGGDRAASRASKGQKEVRRGGAGVESGQVVQCQRALWAPGWASPCSQPQPGHPHPLWALRALPRGLVWETLGSAHLMPRLEVFWDKRGLNTTFRNNGGCQVVI